tara:strand:- start:3277 stop:4107 length:831 start_codon:yes stop_codon:yes gene_type:complete
MYIDEMRLRIWLFGALFPKTHLRDGYNTWITLQNRPKGWVAYAPTTISKYQDIDHPSDWGGFLNAKMRRQITQWDPMILLLPYFTTGRYDEDTYFAESFIRPGVERVGESEKVILFNFLRWLNHSDLTDICRVHSHRQQQEWHNRVEPGSDSVYGVSNDGSDYTIYRESLDTKVWLSIGYHMKVRSSKDKVEWSYHRDEGYPDYHYPLKPKKAKRAVDKANKGLRKIMGLEGYISNVKGDSLRNGTAGKQLLDTLMEQVDHENFESLVGEEFVVHL